MLLSAFAVVVAGKVKQEVTSFGTLVQPAVELSAPILCCLAFLGSEIGSETVVVACELSQHGLWDALAWHQHSLRLFRRMIAIKGA